MAETATPEEQQVAKPNDAADMVVERAKSTAPTAGSKQKRPREEEKEDLPKDDIVSSKKRKVDMKKKKKKKKKKMMKEKVANEEQEKGASEEQKKGGGEEEEAEKKPSGPVKLGYKTFESSVEIFDYFFKLLHAWPLNLAVNKYEHTMLLELLKNGDIDHDGEFSGGIQSFLVRKHPEWQTRCFFFIRKNESVEDFSFRKCVNHILPLPEEMQPNAAAAHQLRGKRGGGRGRGGRDGGQDQGGRGN